MTQWHYLYQTVDGKLVSETDDDYLLTKIPAGLAVRSRAQRWDALAEVWDEPTRNFIPRNVVPNADQLLRLSLLSKAAAAWTDLERSQALRLIVLKMGPL